KARALKIYQELLAFHQADADRSAFLLADLERLRWAAVAADVEGRDARLEAALQRFIEANAASPVSAWARVDLAGRIGEKQPKEAHAVLKAGALAFPEHAFGKLCASGVAELEMREIALLTESHWTPAGEEIR